MTLQEKMDLWEALAKKVREFRQECMAEFSRKTQRCREVAE